jgi:hypothetical protein
MKPPDKERHGVLAVNQPCALFIGEDVKLRLNRYNAASDSPPHKGAVHVKGK